MFEEILALKGHELRQEREVTPEQTANLEQILARLLNHEPVQHILGFAWFLGEKYKVNAATLIPRSETEELVEWIRYEHRNSEPMRVLDIGTGSGCIAIALQKAFPQWEVYGMDISEDALEIARYNAAQILGSFTQQHFFQGNILKPLPDVAHSEGGRNPKPGFDSPSTSPEHAAQPDDLQTFDLIVSNPPYVRELEKAAMRHEVLEYEPGSALFVTNEDPLIFYRTIAEKGKTLLKPSGKLYFEINEYLGKEMLEMLNDLGYETALKKDMQGKDRMVRAVRRN